MMDSGVLYGQDIIYKSEEPVRIGGMSFKGFNDVRVLTTEDFFYNYFAFGDGYFLLYSDDILPMHPFPVASVFSDDISALPFIISGVQAECIPFSPDESVKAKAKSYSRDFREVPREADTHGRETKPVAADFAVVADEVSGDAAGEASESADAADDFPHYKVVSSHFDNPEEIHFSSSVEYIKVCRTVSGRCVTLNAGSTDFVRGRLADFFSLDQHEFMVKQIPGETLRAEYTLSMLRAAFIAVEASRKFDRDVIFQYRPFSCTGAVEVDRRSQINTKSGRVEEEDVSVRVDLGQTMPSESEMLSNLIASCIPSYPVGSMRITITIAHDSCAYTTDIGELSYGKLLSDTVCYQEKICEEMGMTDVMSVIASKRSVLDRYVHINPDDKMLENIGSVLSSSLYFSKRDLCSPSKGAGTEVSSARRLQRTVLAVPIFSKEGISVGCSLPLMEKFYKQGGAGAMFDVSGLSLFVVEYNSFYHEIKKMYAVLCVPEGSPARDLEESRLRGKCLRLCYAYGMRFSAKFSDKDLVLRFVREKNGFSSEGAIECFFRFLKTRMDEA